MSLSQSQLKSRELKRKLARDRRKVGITEPWNPEDNKVFRCPNCHTIHVVPGTAKIYYCNCITRTRPLTQDESIYYGNEDQIMEEVEEYLKIDIDKHIIRKKKNGRY